MIDAVESAERRLRSNVNMKLVMESLVLAMAIQQSFNSKQCPEFDVERFWTQSLMAAEQLAAKGVDIAPGTLSAAECGAADIELIVLN